MKKYLEIRIELIIISLVLIVSIFAYFLLNDSAAWFAKNDNVDSNGMSLSAVVTSNLIISAAPDDITSGVLNFNVDFNHTERNNMIAVTHDADYGATYLKYVTNSYAVNSITGDAQDGQELEFSAVPETDNEMYFFDHTVYIASVTAPLEVTALTATIIQDADSVLGREYLKAASIDFYVDSVSEEGYRGTASFAQSNSVNLLDSEEKSVPLNTEGYITVIMRCYFDGALVNSESGYTYINSEDVDVESIFLGVQFVAEEKK